MLWGAEGEHPHPNKDHTEDLEKCLQSIWKKDHLGPVRGHRRENNSTDPATFCLYEKARQRYDGLKVITYPGQGFNFSAINNFGGKAAEGDYLLLLSNDVEVVNDDWLTGCSGSVPTRRRGDLRCHALVPG